MAITDIFKKEDNKETGAKKGAAVKKEKKIAAIKPGSEAKAVRKISGQAARVLEHAHVTEKASKLADINQYVFNVVKGANKNEVARAIENYYGVKVVGVNVINIPGKRRRRGRGIVNESGYRKAIVSVMKGQTIEVLPQ
jgi:large subunit ribosomal protein L23